jgi:hypothetical protein
MKIRIRRRRRGEPDGHYLTANTLTHWWPSGQKIAGFS